MYSLNQQFNTMEEIIKHIADMEQFKKYLAKKEQKQGDGEEKRGIHMRFLHQKAKELHIANPSMTYKECLKLVSSPTTA
jgi:hypothetical protein